MKAASSTRTSKVVLSVAAAGLAVLGPTGPALAAPSSTGPDAPSAVQAQVDQQLRAYPGGTQVAPNVVEYKHGSVRVVFGTATEAAQGNAQADSNSAKADSTEADVSARATTYVHGCPRGTVTRWFCFYSHGGWNESQPGRMVQFKDAGFQSLVDYGFNDETSSWVNTTTRQVRVFDTSTGSTLLWTEGADSSSSYVGNTNNDRASSFSS